MTFWGLAGMIDPPAGSQSAIAIVNRQAFAGDDYRYQ
jgi:hypothetical protein